MRHLRPTHLAAPLLLALAAGSLVACGPETTSQPVASLEGSTQSNPPVELVGSSDVAVVKSAMTQRKRATVQVKATRTSSGRIQVRVRTNAKHSTIRAYNSSGSRLITKLVRHRSNKKWVKITLAKSANSAKRVAVTTKKVKLNKRLWLLARKKTVAVKKSSSGAFVGSTASTATASAYATALLAAVNDARSVARKCGSKAYPAAGKLTLNDNLNLAAQRHSADMATKNYFDHVSRTGSTHADRATAAGYKWRLVGENIAAGHTSASTALKAWLASPGHCENVMNKSYKDLGVGVASNPTSKYRIYWTQMFGTPR